MRVRVRLRASSASVSATATDTCQYQSQCECECECATPRDRQAAAPASDPPRCLPHAAANLADADNGKCKALLYGIFSLMDKLSSGVCGVRWRTVHSM